MKKASQRKAFTLIELLVVVSIIALLVAILMPALGRAREQARRTVCSNNVKSMSTSLLMYASDNDQGKFPLKQGTLGYWLWDISYATTDYIIKKAGGDKHTFYCPSNTLYENDPRFWRYAEAAPGSNFENQPEPVVNRQNMYRVAGYCFLFDHETTPMAIPTHWKDTTGNLKPGFYAWAKRNTDKKASERPLIVDAILSTPAVPSRDDRSDGNFFDVHGGNWTRYQIPDRSNHKANKTSVPAGGNDAYMDGHVEWKDFGKGAGTAGCMDFSGGFDKMIIRWNVGGPYFWW